MSPVIGTRGGNVCVFLHSRNKVQLSRQPSLFDVCASIYVGETVPGQRLEYGKESFQRSPSDQTTEDQGGSSCAEAGVHRQTCNVSIFGVGWGVK